jgi:hypothetical protein
MLAAPACSPTLARSAFVLCDTSGLQYGPKVRSNENAVCSFYYLNSAFRGSISIYQLSLFSSFEEA